MPRNMIAGLLALLASGLQAWKGITIDEETLEALATAILMLVTAVLSMTAKIKQEPPKGGK